MSVSIYRIFIEHDERDLTLKWRSIAKITKRIGKPFPFSRIFRLAHLNFDPSWNQEPRKSSGMCGLTVTIDGEDGREPNLRVRVV